MLSRHREQGVVHADRYSASTVVPGAAWTQFASQSGTLLVAERSAGGLPPTPHHRFIPGVENLLDMIRHRVQDRGVVCRESRAMPGTPRPGRFVRT